MRRFTAQDRTGRGNVKAGRRPGAGSLAAWAVLASSLVACGAPTKQAADVRGMFTREAVSLADKERALCDALAERKTAPTTQGLPVDLAGCREPGATALNYDDIDAFYFAGLEGGEPAADDLIHKSVRGQLWLNKRLLDLAQGLVEKMNAGGNTGEVKLPDSALGKNFKGLVTPKIEIIEEPVLDMATLSFSMLISLKITGAIEVDHEITATGRLINDAIAVTIATSKDQPIEKSLIKNFHAVALVIPHADDIYIDTFVDLNIHKVGLESVFKDQINTFLSTGLKQAVDTLMTF